jgi:hypothetical protein
MVHVKAVRASNVGKNNGIVPCKACQVMHTDCMDLHEVIVVILTDCMDLHKVVIVILTDYIDLHKVVREHSIMHTMPYGEGSEGVEQISDHNLIGSEGVEQSSVHNLIGSEGLEQSSVHNLISSEGVEQSSVH